MLGNQQAGCCPGQPCPTNARDRDLVEDRSLLLRLLSNGNRSVSTAVGGQTPHCNANTAVGNCHNEDCPCQFEQGVHAVHFINLNATAAMHIVLTIQATDSCQRSGHDHRLGARSGKDEKGKRGFHGTQQTLFSCEVGLGGRGWDGTLYI